MLDPFAVAVAFVDRLLQALDRLVPHALDGVHTRNIVQQLRIFGIDIERTLCPVERLVGLSEIGPDGRADIECSGIIGVDVEPFLDCLDRAMRGLARFADSTLRRVGAGQKRRRVIVLRP